jgi:hypothetical protein
MLASARELRVRSPQVVHYQPNRRLLCQPLLQRLVPTLSLPCGPLVEHTPLFSIMASATGIPAHINGGRDASEDEPLLGQRGDASQMDGQPLYMNLWLGMGFEEKGMSRCG